MKYIIALDFGQGQYYYLRHKEGESTWDEVYSPYMATTFSTKQAAQSFGKDKTSLSQFMKPVKLDDEIKKFDEWVRGGYVRRTMHIVNDEYNVFYDKNIHSKMDVLDHVVKLKLADEDLYTYKAYDSWPYLNELFNYLSSVNLYVDHKANKVINFMIAVNKNKEVSYDIFKEELGYVLDKTTYRINKFADYIPFDIMDYDLSETRNPFLLYKSEDDVIIVNMRSSSFNQYYKGNLEGALEYIKENLYLEY